MTDSQDQAFTTADFLEDFDYLWEAFAAEYAYFDEKDTDWGQVRQHYRKEIESTSEAGAFISILERTLEELGSVSDSDCSGNIGGAPMSSETSPPPPRLASVPQMLYTPPDSGQVNP